MNDRTMGEKLKKCMDVNGCVMIRNLMFKRTGDHNFTKTTHRCQDLEFFHS